MAFNEAVQSELARLKEGDKITAQGAFKVEAYMARDRQTKLSRTIFADNVLALRQPPRERRGINENPAALTDAAGLFDWHQPGKAGET